MNAPKVIYSLTTSNNVSSVTSLHSTMKELIEELNETEMEGLNQAIKKEWNIRAQWANNNGNNSIPLVNENDSEPIDFEKYVNTFPSTIGYLIEHDGYMINISVHTLNKDKSCYITED